MPFFRQLWTVEVGDSTNRATAVVPPRASINLLAGVSMQRSMRESQTQRKQEFAIIAIAIFAWPLSMAL